MRLRLSRRKLRLLGYGALALLAVLGVTIGLYGLGLHITPRTVAQRPILYSPAVRAALDYRSRVSEWLVALDQIDHNLARLIDETSGERNGDLYDQSVRAEETIDGSVRLAQDTTLVSAPTALADLRQQVIAASLTYVTAGRATSILINAPTVENRAAAGVTLLTAREVLATVRSSRWFTQPVTRVTR